MGTARLQKALGCFSEEKYRSFSENMDEVMRKRCHAGHQKGNIDAGYSSDLERDRQSLEPSQDNKDDEPDEVGLSPAELGKLACLWIASVLHSLYAGTGNLVAAG